MRASSLVTDNSGNGAMRETRSLLIAAAHDLSDMNGINNIDYSKNSLTIGREYNNPIHIYWM